MACFLGNENPKTSHPSHANFCVSSGIGPKETERKCRYEGYGVFTWFFLYSLHILHSLSLLLLTFLPQFTSFMSQSFQSTDTYIASRDLQIAVNAALHLQKPLLVKGEPGTGKTLLARAVASQLDANFLKVFPANCTCSRPTQRYKMYSLLFKWL